MRLVRCEFDRGTIILRDLPPGIAGDLPALAWDDRIAAHRAAPSDWPALREVLDAFGPLDAPAAAPPLGMTLRSPELRAHQRVALDTWMACGQRGIVVLPTGSGKTRIALAAIAALGLPALVLVPTRVLLAQWVASLSELGAGPIGQLGDSRSSIEPLTVATYESAWRHAASLGDRFGLIVVDEAHHVGGALRVETLESSMAPFRLGLTALTPGGRDPSRREALVGPVVFRLAVRDLAGSGLAPMRLVGVGLDMTPEERGRWMADISCYRAERARVALEAFGQPWSGLMATMARTESGRRALAARARAQRLSSLTAAKRLALAAILEHHRDDRTLVFTADNASAYAIARAHLVPALTCDVGPRERREFLAAFARGSIRTLVSARVLDEGVDVPEARVAVIVGASGSERQHVQRVGRILRPLPGKLGIVYDVFNLEAGEAFGAARRRRAVAP